MPIYHVMRLERDWMETTVEVPAVGSPVLLNLSPRCHGREEFQNDLHAYAGLNFESQDGHPLPGVVFYKILGWYVDPAGHKVFYETLMVENGHKFIPFALRTIGDNTHYSESVLNIENLNTIHHLFGAAVSTGYLIDPKRAILEGDHDLSHQLRIHPRYVDVVNDAFLKVPYLKGLCYDYASPLDATADLNALVRISRARSELDAYTDRTLVSTVAPLGLDPAIAVRFAQIRDMRSPTEFDLMASPPIDVSPAPPVPVSELTGLVYAKSRYMNALAPLFTIGTDYQLTIQTQWDNWDGDLTIDINALCDRYAGVCRKTRDIAGVTSRVRDALYGLLSILTAELGVTQLKTIKTVQIQITRTFGEELLLIYSSPDEKRVALCVYVDRALRSLVSCGAAYA